MVSGFGFDIHLDVVFCRLKCYFHESSPQLQLLVFTSALHSEEVVVIPACKVGFSLPLHLQYQEAIEGVAAFALVDCS